MDKTHISKSGIPSTCRATVKPCPLGGPSGSEQHFSNEAIAFECLETSYKAEDILANFGMEDEMCEAEERLVRAIKNKAFASAEEIEEHQKYIQKATSILIGAGAETYNEKSDPMVAFSDERRREHQEILKELDAIYSTAKRERKLIVAGGTAGAGKSTALKTLIDQGDYATVNPDDIKEIMAKRGLIPKVPGATPMDVSTLVHNEASYIASIQRQKLLQGGYNVILDMTMGSNPNSKVAPFADAGYEITGVYVDVPLQTSLLRSASRYQHGLNEYLSGNGLGGRFVPQHVITNQKGADGYNSRNAQNFEEADKSGMFDKAMRFSNNGRLRPIPSLKRRS